MRIKPFFRRVGIAFGFFLVAILVDQYVKISVQRNIFFRDDVQLNCGMSFGIGCGSDVPSILFFIALLILFFVYVTILVRIRSVSQSVAWSLFFAGACSNMIDRVLFGAVVDWIPFFIVKNNLADWMIVLSALWIVGVQCFSWTKQKCIWTNR